jgi:hypothetical protein
MERANLVLQNFQSVKLRTLIVQSINDTIYLRTGKKKLKADLKSAEKTHKIEPTQSLLQKKFFFVDH